MNDRLAKQEKRKGFRESEKQKEGEKKKVWHKRLRQQGQERVRRAAKQVTRTERNSILRKFKKNSRDILAHGGEYVPRKL